MPRASGPALPDIASALARRRGDGEELRRVARHVDEMVATAGLAALDAALALIEDGSGAREAAQRIADDIARRTEALEREVGRVVPTLKPA